MYNGTNLQREHALICKYYPGDILPSAGKCREAWHTPELVMPAMRDFLENRVAVLAGMADSELSGGMDILAVVVQSRGINLQFFSIVY